MPSAWALDCNTLHTRKEFAAGAYRVTEGGIVEAMMPGGLVRFNNMDQFRAASEGRDSPRPSDVDLTDFRDVMGGVRYKVNADNTVTAWTPTGERTYSSWASFHQATKTRRWS